MDYLTSLLPAIDTFHSIGYWLAFFSAFFETVIGVGLLLPGTSIIVILGAFAAQGYLDVGDLIWFAIFGAILGDNINYFLGKKYGANWIKNGVWFIKPEHLKKSREFLNKHGVKSIFLARFVPGLKELVPLIAGMVKMKRKPFFIWNVFGGIGWGIVFVLFGYIFSQSLNLAQTWLSKIGFFFAILILFFILFYILKWIIIKQGRQFFLIIKSLLKSIRHSINTNSDVKKFIENHSKFVNFLKRRFDKTVFSGLPLTISAIAFLYVFSLFGGIVEDIITSDIIVAADVRIENLLQIFRTDILTNIFFWITLLGKAEIILVFSLVVAALFWLSNKRFYIIPFITAILGSSLFTYLGKIAFHRARPDVAIYIENSFSFPSGHATIAVAFYGFLVYVFMRAIDSWKGKVNIFFFGFIIILAIGFSRLYLGVHYLSDIWAGYLVGALWLIIGITISEWLLFKKNNKVINVNKNKIKFISSVLVIASLLFYIGFAMRYNPPINTFYKNSKIIKNNDVLNLLSENNLKYTESILGQRQEPINFIIFAKNDEVLIDAFKKSGWYLADRVSFYSVSKTLKDSFLNSQYLTAPMTPSFWNSEVNDFGFEKPTQENTVKQRHHARFWKTNYKTIKGYKVYAGAASLDSGVKWFITHKIKSDIDTEREFLFDSLNSTGVVSEISKVEFVKPYIGVNFSGDQFFTDGFVYILKLK